MELMTLHSISMGVSWGVNVLLRVVLLVVVVAVVRRLRPDASTPLVVWSVAELVWSVIGQAIFMGATWLAGNAGVDSMLTAQLGATFLSTLVHVGLTVLLLYGLVRLARAPAVRPPSTAHQGAV